MFFFFSWFAVEAIPRDDTYHIVTLIGTTYPINTLHIKPAAAVSNPVFEMTSSTIVGLEDL
jgi:hypothetical protein